MHLANALGVPLIGLLAPLIRYAPAPFSRPLPVCFNPRTARRPAVPLSSICNRRW